MGVLKAYFDNSGKPQDPNVDWVALAGYFAPEDAWLEFDQQWAKAISPYPYLHMGELIHSDGPFKGKTIDEKRILLVKARGALMEMGDRFIMRAVACAADKLAYEEAKAVNPGINSIPEECGDICVSHIFEQYGSDDLIVQIFYDQGEAQFYGSLLRAWDDKKLRRSNPLLKTIKVKPSPVDDMLEIPGMQAADFLAWHTYQAHAEQDHTLAFPAMLSVITRFVTIDEAYWAGEPTSGPDDKYYLYFRPKNN